MPPLIFARKALSFYFLMLTLLPSVSNCLVASATKLPDCQPLRVPQTAAHKLFNSLSNCLPRNSPGPNYQRLTPGCRSTTPEFSHRRKAALSPSAAHRAPAATFLLAQFTSQWPQGPTTCVTLNCFGFFELWFWSSIFLCFYFLFF